MSIIKRWLYKYKWIMVVSGIIVAGCLFAISESNYYGESLKAFAFQDYVARDYMPSMRRETKTWPVTLKGLPERITAGKVSKSFASRTYLLQEYYYDGFVKIEPIQICPKSYVFRIYTKIWNGTCKSTINPDFGICWSDSE